MYSRHWGSCLINEIIQFYIDNPQISAKLTLYERILPIHNGFPTKNRNVYQNIEHSAFVLTVDGSLNPECNLIL